MTSKKVFIVPSYHCDVVWRRPPQEQAAIREVQFDSALDMLDRCPQFRFELDQASITREYLEAHPERMEQVRRFIAEGRLEITGGEEAIPDTNMVTGEGLVRNFLLGRLWFEETLGVRPVVANLDDAFGLSAQLPQVFLGLGYRCLRSARTPGLDSDLAKNGILWEGLDGTRIFYGPSHGSLSTHTHVCNLPVVYEPMERARAYLEEAVDQGVPVVYCRYSSEEDPVQDDVVQLVLDFQPPQGTTVRFALCSEVMEEMQRACGSPPVIKGEFNPSEPGTYISRITLKRAYRRAEWAAICAEAAAACAALDGGAYPREQFAEMWRKLSVVQFHDSLCGCHVDTVNRMVMGYCAEVSKSAEAIANAALGRIAPPTGKGRAVVAFNPLPMSRREPVELPLPEGTCPAGPEGTALAAERRGDSTLVMLDLPPMGIGRWNLVSAPAIAPQVHDAPEAEWRKFKVGPYSVVSHRDGVLIAHQQWGRTLVDGNFPQVRFRLDDGTLWKERFLGPTYNDEAGEKRLERVEEGPVSVRFVWAGEVRGERTADPPPPFWKSHRNGKPVIFADLKRLTWEKELIFYHDLDRIDAIIRIDWEGNNTEILVGFPLQLDLAQTRATYGVPFGAMERKPYFEVPFSSPEKEGAPLHLAQYDGKGAWPALGWVAYGDDRWGMALANRGTPGHRLMNGMIEVGILRSPTTKSSNFSVPRSAYENGRHEFRFALMPFRGDWRDGHVHQLGDCFNARPIVRLAEGVGGAGGSHTYLSLSAPGVAFSAFKKAERRDGFVLRTFETEGRPAQGSIETSFALASVEELDLMERPVRQVDPGKLTWRPFEIKTLLLEPKRD